MARFEIHPVHLAPAGAVHDPADMRPDGRHCAHPAGLERGVKRGLPEVVPAEEAATPSELGRWLDEHADLKPAHRACLILRYAYGMERSEIARATGMTEMQVKSALQYGLQLLRQRIVPVKR